MALLKKILQLQRGVNAMNQEEGKGNAIEKLTGC
jgi:hypothetical protein